MNYELIWRSRNWFSVKIYTVRTINIIDIYCNVFYRFIAVMLLSGCFSTRLAINVSIYFYAVEVDHANCALGRSGKDIVINIDDCYPTICTHGRYSYNQCKPIPVDKFACNSSLVFNLFLLQIFLCLNPIKQLRQDLSQMPKLQADQDRAPKPQAAVVHQPMVCFKII